MQLWLSVLQLELGQPFPQRTIFHLLAALLFLGQRGHTLTKGDSPSAGQCLSGRELLCFQSHSVPGYIVSKTISSQQTSSQRGTSHMSWTCWDVMFGALVESCTQF